MSLSKKLRKLAALLVYRLLNPGVTIWNPDGRELAAIKAQGYQGQAAQDFFLHKRFFQKTGRTGVYVDVGANQPIYNSNTCYFDKVLGWSGVAVEPLNRFAADWARERSASLLAFAATECREVLRFDEVIDAAGTPFSSVHGSSAKNSNLKLSTIEVQGERLDVLLLDRNITAVDMMSIDVEGHEMQVLRGLDFNKIKVRVLIIENNVPAFNGNREIRDYLKRAGYRHVARVWHLDDVFVLERRP